MAFSVNDLFYLMLETIELLAHCQTRVPIVSPVRCWSVHDFKRASLLVRANYNTCGWTGAHPEHTRQQGKLVLVVGRRSKPGCKQVNARPALSESLCDMRFALLWQGAPRRGTEGLIECLEFLMSTPPQITLSPLGRLEVQRHRIRMNNHPRRSEVRSRRRIARMSGELSQP